MDVAVGGQYLELLQVQMDFDFTITARGWSVNSIAEIWMAWAPKIVRFCADNPALLAKEEKLMDGVDYDALTNGW